MVENDVGNTYATPPDGAESQTSTRSSAGISFQMKTSSVGARGPLNKLFTNEFEMDNLKYPEEVGTDEKRPHVVKFFINVPEASSFNLTQGSNAFETPIAAQQTLLGSENTGFSATVGGLLGATAGLVGSKKSMAAAGLTKNQTIGAGLIGGVVGAASGAALNAPITPKQNRLKGSITLYMPDTVNMSYEVGYQDDNLTDNTIAYLGNLGVAMKDATGTALESAFKNLTSGKAGEGAAGSALGASALAALRVSPYGNVLPVDALLKGQGVAINPQVQLLFKAVSLRTFQMEFMFSPKSQKESQAVVDIVRTFKFHAAPEVGGTADGGRSTGLFFIVPSTFNIEFLFRRNKNMNQNTSIHRIGECVLENVNVDYAPNGWSTFEDGSPTQVRLTLNFKETDIVDKNKVAQGY